MYFMYIKLSELKKDVYIESKIIKSFLKVNFVLYFFTVIYIDITENLNVPVYFP